MFQRVVDVYQSSFYATVPCHFVGQRKTRNALNQEAPNMQHFVANTAVGEIAVGRRDEPHASGLNFHLQLSSPGHPSIIEVGIFDHLNRYARGSFNLSNEGLHWRA